MKKNIFTISLALATLLSGFGTFYSVNRAVEIIDASTWLVPMLWVSLFIISICLMAIFIKDNKWAKLFVALSFSFSIFFTFSIIHFAILLLCILLALSSLSSIRNDLDLNVKINLWKSLYVGKFKIIFALSLIICTQYFFTVKSMDGPVNIPRLDLSGISGKLVGPMLGIINPGFAEASRQDLTIDQFIIQSQKKESDSFDLEYLQNEELIDANIPQDIPLAQKQALKQQALLQVSETKARLLEQNQAFVLEEGRRQFSIIADKQINGDEKISIVFANMINDKINDYFQTGVESNERPSLFPLIFSVILFLTIWPLGSLLSTVWFAIVVLFFKATVYFGLVSISTVTVQREIIS